MSINLFRLLLLLVFVGVLPVGCCPEQTLRYLKIRGFDLYLTEPPTTAYIPLTNGMQTSAPELLATVRFEFDAVAAVRGSLPFVSSAQAFQCEEPGGEGLKEALIVDIVEFTSTGVFNGVAAGQSLQRFVRCKGGYSRSGEFPLSQLADSLSTWEANELQFPLELRISPKPTDNARQQFRLRIRLKNGQEFLQETPAIIWN